MGSSASGTEPNGHEEIVQFGRPRRRRAGLGSLPLALLAVVAVVTIVRHSGGQPHRPPPPPVAVTDVGHPILGIKAGWELFGLGSSGVVAVQFSRGQITRTALPPDRSGSQVSFIVDSDKVIVRPLDNVPGYVVPDGQPARRLTGVLSHGALLLPGPGRDEMWDIRGPQSLALIGAHGQLLRTGFAGLPGRFTLLASTADGSGNVLLSGNNGQQYDTGSGIVRPVGALLVAVGPRDWLGLSCDQQRNCHNVVITAATGATRPISGPAFSAVNWPWLSPAGVVAPDGSMAALLATGTFGTTALDLVNLTSGAVRGVQVPVVPHASSQTLAWSPDSRWLFVITARGHLAVVNPRTGRVQDLGLGLSGLRQIAIRGRER